MVSNTFPRLKIKRLQLKETVEFCKVAILNNSILLPRLLICERILCDAKLSAGGENWQIQTRKNGLVFEPNFDNFVKGSSDHWF